MSDVDLFYFDDYQISKEDAYVYIDHCFKGILEKKVGLTPSNMRRITLKHLEKPEHREPTPDNFTLSILKYNANTSDYRLLDDGRLSYECNLNRESFEILCGNDPLKKCLLNGELFESTFNKPDPIILPPKFPH